MISMETQELLGVVVSNRRISGSSWIGKEDQNLCYHQTGSEFPMFAPFGIPHSWTPGGLKPGSAPQSWMNRVPRKDLVLAEVTGKGTPNCQSLQILFFLFSSFSLFS